MLLLSKRSNELSVKFDSLADWTCAFDLVLNVILLWIIQQHWFACSSNIDRNNAQRPKTESTSILSKSKLLIPNSLEFPDMKTQFDCSVSSFAQRNHLNCSNIMRPDFNFAILFPTFNWIVQCSALGTRKLCSRWPCAWIQAIHFLWARYNISSQIVFDSWKQVERKCNTPFLGWGRKMNTQHCSTKKKDSEHAAAID